MQRMLRARNNGVYSGITRVLPPASRFDPHGGHSEKKQRVLARLGEFFERFFGLGSSGDVE